jgi:hypothetical protein
VLLPSLLDAANVRDIEILNNYVEAFSRSFQATSQAHIKDGASYVETGLVATKRANEITQSFGMLTNNSGASVCTDLSRDPCGGGPSRAPPCDSPIRRSIAEHPRDTKDSECKGLRGGENPFCPLKAVDIFLTAFENSSILASLGDPR